MHKKKINILNISLPNSGAAGIAAYNFHQVLKNSGHNSMLLVQYDIVKENTGIISYYNSFQWLFVKYSQKVVRKLKSVLGIVLKTNPEYYFQGGNELKNHANIKKILKKIKFKPEFIVLYFIDGFINFKNIFELHSVSSAPIIYYMMDMVAFTGGCHYAWECMGFTKNCGRCPGLYSDNPNDQTNINWSFKKEYIDKINIIPIAGTEWQYNQLKKSSLFSEKNKYKILLSTDTNLFKPADKMEARKKLNVTIDKKIIFFGAVTVTENRKGFKELVETLRILKKMLSESERENIHLIIAGNYNEDFVQSFEMPFTFLGYLSQTQLATAYQAANIFVSPSIEDSGPMMVNQSIMSGTPVVAFEMGVALDLVITAKTGYRAKLKDSNDLAKGIKYVLDLTDYEYKEMSDNCRELGLQLCHPKKQAEKFIEIFEKNVNWN